MSAADPLADLADIRRHLHRHPELAYAEHQTADVLARELTRLGLEVHRGLGGTGIVAVRRGRTSGRAVGLRADMDALPIEERTNLPHASRHAGVMHACGHDGHSAMLLGAARLLAAAPPLPGDVVLIFQPAEEGGAGARAMIEDGLFRRFPCQQVFALHNWPDLPPGELMIRPGPMMAAADSFDILIHGRGGHAGIPQRAIDPVVIAGQLITAAQALVSRTIHPAAAGLVSITRLDAGSAYNVIPETVHLRGTLRYVSDQVGDTLARGLRALVEQLPRAFGGSGELSISRGYPATVNEAGAAAIARRAALSLSPQPVVRDDLPPSMGTEDFAFMLQAVPGAYLWIGNGGQPLHSPHYDFNDDILETGARLLAALARTALDPPAAGEGAG